MRLRSPDVEIGAEPVTFTYNGTPLTALPGESLASALIGAGQTRFRTTRTHAPRGVFCGMGVCFDCLVVVDGKASQRACLTMARAGMVVSSQRDDGRAAGGAGRPLACAPAGDIPVHGCELLVVGAGPAGLSAAAVAARAGAGVTIVDERPYPGGQYFKPLATPFRVRAGKTLDAQFEAGRELTARVEALGVTLVSDATVWGGMRDAEGRLEIGVWRDGAARMLRPEQLIIATGAYERPLLVPGWTLPGVMTTGAAQTLARAYRVAPGERILVAGNGPLNLQVACELARGGAKVVAVAEAAKAPWRRLHKVLAACRYGPRWMAHGCGYLSELRRQGIDVLYEHVLLRVDGVAKAQSATLAALGAGGSAMPRTRRYDVDAVCMGYGFLPASELARQLDCAHRVAPAGAGILVTEREPTGKTSAADIYVVGDAGEIAGAQCAMAQAELAGASAATALGHALPGFDERRALRRLERRRAFQRALWSLFESPPLGVQFADAETHLCRCEEVTLARLRALIESGVTHPSALKRLTRAGMGRCQGRYCAGLLSQLIAEIVAQPPQAAAHFAPQLPLKPVPASTLAVEKDEWGGHRRVQLDNQKSHRDARTCPVLETEVLVIGAGIAGVSTAYFLARAGRDVLLVDRGEANGEASGANAGSLHVQLLSFDFGSKAEAGGAPAAATLSLQKASVALWRELERSLDQDFELRLCGGLMVAESPRELDFLEKKCSVERKHGIEVEMVGRSALRTLAPAVSDRMCGAAYCADEGKLNPLLATNGVFEAARAAGARLEVQTPVSAIERSGREFRVLTERGVIRCARIVNAAGAWSACIAAMVDVALPVHGAPLQMIVTEPTAPLIDLLLAHAGRHLTLKQVRNGNLIIGGGWPAVRAPSSGYLRVLRASVEGNLWVALRTLPALSQLHILRTWAAMNVNIDGAPVLGEVPGVPGFYNAVTSNGYTLGPMVGQLTASLIADGEAHWDMAPFAITRFA